MSGPCLLDELDRIVGELNEELPAHLDERERKEHLMAKASAVTGLADHVLAEAVDRVLAG